jgi:hypothetical protein
MERMSSREGRISAVDAFVVVVCAGESETGSGRGGGTEVVGSVAFVGENCREFR